MIGMNKIAQIMAMYGSIEKLTAHYHTDQIE